MVETHHTIHINLVPSVCWIWMDGTIPNFSVLAGIEWSSRSGFFDCGGSFRKSKEASLNQMWCFSFVIDVYKGNNLIWEYLGIPSFRHTFCCFSPLIVFSLVRSTVLDGPDSNKTTVES